jgi:hypothetical protein
MAVKKTSAKVNEPKVTPQTGAYAPLPEVDAEEESDKLHGQTESQKEIESYHKGAFQTHDPVTGKKRDEKLPE